MVKDDKIAGWAEGKTGDNSSVLVRIGNIWGASKEYAPKHKDEYYKMQVIEMADHIGTHIEMPAHYKADGWDGSTFPLERLAHEAVIVDISQKKPGEQIEVDDLKDVQECDIVLLKTGNGGSIPFSEKAVEFLISKKVEA